MYDNFFWHIVHRVIKQFKSIQKSYDQLQPFKNLKNILNKKTIATKRYDKTKEKLNSFKEKYKKTLKDKGICPVCKQDIDEIEI